MDNNVNENPEVKEKKLFEYMRTGLNRNSGVDNELFKYIAALAVDKCESFEEFKTRVQLDTIKQANNTKCEHLESYFTQKETMEQWLIEVRKGTFRTYLLSPNTDNDAQAETGFDVEGEGERTFELENGEFCPSGYSQDITDSNTGSNYHPDNNNTDVNPENNPCLQIANQSSTTVLVTCVDIIPLLRDFKTKKTVELSMMLAHLTS